MRRLTLAIASWIHYIHFLFWYQLEACPVFTDRTTSRPHTFRVSHHSKMNTDKTALAADVDLQSVDVAENLLDADNGSSQAFGPTEATTRTATPTTNHLGQDPVRSASDHYISLDISRDSDDYKKKSVYHKTTTVNQRFDVFAAAKFCRPHPKTLPSIVSFFFASAANCKGVRSNHERRRGIVTDHGRYEIARPNTSSRTQRH